MHGSSIADQRKVKRKSTQLTALDSRGLGEAGLAGNTRGHEHTNGNSMLDWGT